MSKSIVIFDNSNFYFKLKSLKYTKTHNFHYLQFAQHLTQSSQLEKIYVCMGKIRAKNNSEHAQTLMRKQQQLIARLEKDGAIVQLGYLLASDDGTYHEKGVDVQIATNILRGAFRNEFDTCYLISSDSDLIPAIVAAQSYGKTIVYIGFHHQPSFALLRTAKESKLLTKEDISKFL